MSPIVKDLEVLRDFKLEDIRVETFTTSMTVEGEQHEDWMSTYCTCSSCDATTSGSGPCGSACGITYCHHSL
jgi:hypothetical protein